RHTSFSRDWSSDVCSSDLTEAVLRVLERRVQTQELRVGHAGEPAVGVDAIEPQLAGGQLLDGGDELFLAFEPLLHEAERGLLVRSEERRVGKECSRWRLAQ